MMYHMYRSELSVSASISFATDGHDARGTGFVIIHLQGASTRALSFTPGGGPTLWQTWQAPRSVGSPGPCCAPAASAPPSPQGISRAPKAQAQASWRSPCAAPRSADFSESFKFFPIFVQIFSEVFNPFSYFFQIFSIGFIVSSLFFSIIPIFFRFFQLFFRVPLGGAGFPGFLRVSWGSLGGATAHARGDAVFFPFFNFFQIFADSPDFFSDVFQSSAWQGRISRVLACFLGVSRGSYGAHPRRCSFFSAFFQFFSRSSFFLVAHTPLRIGVNSDGANPPAHMYLMSLGR